MRQIFLKASFDLGWASADYRVALGGQGETAYFSGSSSENSKVVVPLNGTFSNLSIYSPAGTHPSYTVTLLVNGVVSALTCAITSAETTAQDITHTVNVVAGDDICFRVNVSPFGSGTGYPLSLSVEFEGVQQFYGLNPIAGGHNLGTYNTGGALGNGIQQILSATNQLSNSYSICTVPGTLTGMRMKCYSGAHGANGFTAYIIKNQVLQNGLSGTIDTACILTGANTQANNTFSLPIVIGDHLDFALLRTGTTDSLFALAEMTISVLFTPTDTKSFMCCGGSNNANEAANIEYRWVHSQQLKTNESIVQCPIGPRGVHVTGLRCECGNPSIGRSVVYTIRKNGVDTAATVTIAGPATSAVISGLSIPFAGGDLISLKAAPVNSPTLGNGMYWGLSMKDATTANDTSGIYYINPAKATDHDSYYNDIEKKIPDPTIKTAILGE